MHCSVLLLVALILTALASLGCDREREYCDHALRCSDAAADGSAPRSTTAVAESGSSVPTLTASSSSPMTDSGATSASSGDAGGSGGAPGHVEAGVSDSGSLLDAAAVSSSLPSDGGPSLDASLDAATDAATDAQVADAEAGTGAEDPCPGCECIDSFDCNFPLPICSPQHTCIECDDSDNLGCSGDKPWCKGGFGLEDNTCVVCRDHSDCSDDDIPACEMDECVVCSIADNHGCSEEAPLCVTGAEGNHCVQCVGSEDCSADAPICDDSVCIRCTTQQAEAGYDSGCTEEGTPRCFEGAVPTENSCVECLGESDCNPELPHCAEDNTCVECLQSEHCEDLAAPRCDGEGACAGCESDDDCERFPGAPQCDVQSGACVECTSDDHCPQANSAACGEDFSCGACTSNSDCEHLDGLGVCNSGLCVQCNVQDESACGSNNIDYSCNPATNTCTNTPRGSVGTCRQCVADSECINSNLRCVPLNFQGSYHGSYCMLQKTGSCNPPYANADFLAQSLSGAAEATYCGIPQNLVTCEAVKNFGTACSGENDCSPGQGGLCRSVGGDSICSYRCSAPGNCNDGLSCDDADVGDMVHCN